MTREQKEWIDKNPPYRVMTRAAGSSYYTKAGMLHTDGTFEPRMQNGRLNVRPGSFEVGILEFRSTTTMQGPIM